jgi:hypothetical protein
MVSSDKLNPLERYSKPTKFDLASYGTLWKDISEDKSSWYVQMSNEETPRWEPLGYVLETAFNTHILDQKFLDECLRLYKHHAEPPINTIINLLYQGDVK